MAVGQAVAAGPAAGGTPLAHWTLDDGAGARAVEAIAGRGDPIHYVFNHARFKPDSDPLWRAAGSCVHGTCLMFDGYSTDIAAPGLRSA